MGIDLVGVEVAYKAYIKELYGNEYNWIGTKWMTDNAMKYLDLTYPDDKEDILKVYNGAFGLQDRIVAEESGEKFRQDYKALFNSEPTS